MPVSRSRMKPTPVRDAAVRRDDTPNPSWFVPTFITLLVVGLVWVVTTYISDTRYPIPALGGWNLLVGFAFILTGFGMTMRWK